ncbi:MAG: M28 family metallopeptidase [Thermoanaerobaculia bacterium]|nr:M28 family metallopeptidase [Thermoanaerobaculia bacterium]
MRSTIRCSAFLAGLFILPTGATAGDVSLAAVRAHLDFLADDALEGRDAGTRGYDLAALYAAAQFRQAGLEPGHGDSYLQPVALLESRRTSSTVERLDVAAAQPLAWKQDYLLSVRPDAPTVDVAAPVVFAGFGIDAPAQGRGDYDGLDVAGKIVLVLSGAPADFASEVRAHYSSSRQKRIEAAKRGAVGLLTLKTRDDERRSPWERSTLNADRPATVWLRPDGSVVDDAPSLRFTGAVSHAGARRLLAGSGATLDEILDLGDSGGRGSRPLGVSLRVRLEASQRRLTSPNVVAVLPGADPALRAELVVCSAHLDHVGVGAEVDGDRIYNGFYDNAMGSAMVLEMARVLAAAPERPRRTLVFLLVTAEERGLLGSDAFAQHPSVPGTIVANINLDMPLFLHPAADLVAFGAEHTTLGETARVAAEAHGFRLSPDPEPEESIFVRSDQYSFVRQGVPAIYLDTGFAARDGSDAGRAASAGFRASHYHRPSDEAGLGADWDGVARFTAANAALARAVADAPERPRWLAGSFFGELFGGAQGSGATPSSR